MKAGDVRLNGAGLADSSFSVTGINDYGSNDTAMLLLDDGTLLVAMMARGHVLLQPRLYVEILDADGRPAPEPSPSNT